MKEVKLDITKVGFPSHFLSDKEKDSSAYGLGIGESIQYEWFQKDGSSCRFQNQRAEFHKRRLYAIGKQPVEKYKNEIAVNGDLSYLNLDWTPLKIIPKFVDIVVNGMAERVFTPRAYAQDAMSQAKRSKYQDLIQGQMLAKPILNTIMENTGANPFTVSPEDLPNSDEELSLYMQLNYKPAIEIAEEVAINTVIEENHYIETRKKSDYDVAVIGIGIQKHEFLIGAGVKISYVDPAMVVYSYTEDLYFRDCFYWGEVKTMAVTELVKIDPDLTNDELTEISKFGQLWNAEYGQYTSSQTDAFLSDTCTILYFNYKTTKKVTYKKKKIEGGGTKFIEKDDDFNPPEEMMEDAGFEKVQKTIDVWYDGVLVLGTKYLLKWEMSKNMVRPKSASQHALPNYVAIAPRMYKGYIDSLVCGMIPPADLIQLTHLKLQQVTARVVPDGVFLDVDGINEVDMGTGNAYTPDDALNLYFQTGSVVGRSYTQDGEFNNARVPITQLNASSGSSKAQMLIYNYNHYLDQIRNITGLNEAVDGSSPNPHSLVGLQKMAALSSNTATRHILNAGLHLFQGICEAVTYRISDLLEYSDMKEQFVNQVGEYNASILEEVKELYLSDFGIFIDISPDEEQRSSLERNIDIALTQKNIDIEDAIDIREIKNIKLANQLIKLKRKSKMDREEKMEMQKQAMAGQQSAQAEQMRAASLMQLAEIETNSKIKVKQAEVAFDIERTKAEAEQKLLLMRQEFQMNMQLKGMDIESLNKRDSIKETEKSNRISQQSTEQSKLINQRKNNLPPMSFESNEDTLDGFDLSEFNPR